MKKCIEGSQAVAHAVKMCKPDVIASFPITPQTHIVETLAKIKADGQADYEFINSDSEFASASIILGASASGGRTYTATSSQGLLLMTEVLFSIAGMRLPVVITCANRAISSPINIWNDQQDSMTVRDAGWVMLYASDNQMALDLHFLAFKIAEQLRVPVMVNMDGFVLTHTYEGVELPEQKQVDDFLPEYNAQEGQFLDVTNPVSLGCFATPADYQDIRLELHQDLKKFLPLFKKENIVFKKIFNRSYKAVDYIGPKDAETVIVSMGAVVGTINETIETYNKKNNKKVALLNLVCFRPFPDKEVIKFLKDKKNIIIVEKDISLGSEGGLAIDLKRALYGNSKAKINSYSIGLGGLDIRQKDILSLIKKVVK